MLFDQQGGHSWLDACAAGEDEVALPQPFIGEKCIARSARLLNQQHTRQRVPAVHMRFKIAMDLTGSDMRQHQSARAKTAILQAGVEQRVDGPGIVAGRGAAGAPHADHHRVGIRFTQRQAATVEKRPFAAAGEEKLIAIGA